MENYAKIIVAKNQKFILFLFRNLPQFIASMLVNICENRRIYYFEPGSYHSQNKVSR